MTHSLVLTRDQLATPVGQLYVVTDPDGVVRALDWHLDGGLISGNLNASGNHKPRCAVPRLGEPTHLGVETRALPGLLACAGLALDADVGLAEYARRALGEVSSDLRGYSCRLAAAHVRGPAIEVAEDDGPLN